MLGSAGSWCQPRLPNKSLEPRLVMEAVVHSDEFDLMPIIGFVEMCGDFIKGLFLFSKPRIVASDVVCAEQLLIWRQDFIRAHHFYPFLQIARIPLLLIGTSQRIETGFHPRVVLAEHLRACPVFLNCGHVVGLAIVAISEKPVPPGA